MTALFAAVVCSLLAYAAFVFLADERASGSELMLGVPSWIGLSILPAGYVLLAVHFIVRAVESIVEALRSTAQRGA